MRVNERSVPWNPSLTLAEVRALYKPDADIVIHNGFPVPETAWLDTTAAENDTVTLIRRGETLSIEETARLLHARHTPGVAEVLAEATVGIAGAGGLGSHVADALARSGVGRLVLVDFDVVEPSNLNRQMYRIADIGLPKAAAMQVEIGKINPMVMVDARELRLTREAVKEVFAECRVVVECFDRPEAKQMLAEAVLTELPQATLVAASGVAGVGDANRIRTRKVRERFYLVGDEESAAAPGQGLMAPRVMVAAGHQANAVLQILLGKME